MFSTTFYFSVLAAWAVTAIVIFFVLLWVPAPYGRFARAGWGPGVPSRISWLVMESPAVLVFLWLFAISSQKPATAWAFCLLWNLHYLYRAFIYPWRVRTSNRVPLTVAVSGWGFNVLNGYLQAAYLFHIAASRESSWLLDVRFLMGLLLFVAGWTIHIHADSTLRALRRSADGYQIPQGGLFRWVSCPNYGGELLEWCGWALLTWSWPGLAFAVWTAANLIPRALSSHAWYRKQFADYPRDRKAILPWLL